MGDDSENIVVTVTFDGKTGDVHVRGPKNTLFCLGMLEMAAQSMREIRSAALAAPVIPIAGRDIPFPQNGHTRR